MNPIAVKSGDWRKDMGGTQISYVCRTPEHVAAPYPKYPYISLHEGQWAMCIADGRQTISGAHTWKRIEPASVEMLALGGMTRRSA